MTAYKDLSKEELLELKSGLEAQFEEVKAKGLKLDMSRGKPSADQLNLSMGMMDTLTSGVDLTCEDGVDCRNYGGLDGIDEAKCGEQAAHGAIPYLRRSDNRRCLCAGLPGVVLAAACRRAHRPARLRYSHGGGGHMGGGDARCARRLV